LSRLSENTLYHDGMPRPYELKARAESQAQTRHRIVEAAIELHQANGPAHTSVTAIAERAGVGRLSVYRHFPEQADLLAACSGLYWERKPAPNPAAWRHIADPIERLRVALQQTYEYHRETAPMISRALAEVGDQPHMRPYHEHWRHAADLTAAAWRQRGRQRQRIRAAIGHALSFSTWQSLTQEQGLSDDEAIQLMLHLVTCRGRLRKAPGTSPTRAAGRPAAS
jgi:AcrR family transcriptional regulator